MLFNRRCMSRDWSNLSKHKKYGGSCIYSDASTFSFHAIKNITTAEGGCVTTNSNKLYEKMRLYRSHGIEKNLKKIKNLPEKNASWYYEAKELGWNYRLNELSCALGNNQLKYLGSNIRIRTNIANLYNKFLYSVENINLPSLQKNILHHAWHLYSIRINFDILRISRGKVLRN